MSSHGTSFKDRHDHHGHKDCPNQQKNGHKQCNETGHLIVNMMKSQWKLRQLHGQNFQWRESHCRTNSSIIGMREIQKSRTVRITVWDTSRKVNHLSKVIWDRKIITEFTRSISSTRIGKPVLMMGIKVSKNKHISRWVDQENLSMLDEIESKTVHKDEEGGW